MIYHPLVEEYFFKPKHVGEIDCNLPNTLHTGIGIVGQGDYYVLYVSFEKACVRRASFKAYGNPYLLASLEWACNQLEKAKIDELVLCKYQDLLGLFDMPKRYYPTALQVEKGYNKMVQLLRESNV